ncbi:MAG: hypothetical protein HZA54_05800 [Planctomycetes bacterium]|nr:hypothetical protein [Planctomycetota bacterium]
MRSTLGSRSLSSLLLLLPLLLAASGCDRRDAGTGPGGAAGSAPAPFLAVLGRRGVGPGEFSGPRALDVDPQGNVIVLDRAGRLQVFAPDGARRAAWEMPAVARGTPEDVEVDREGNYVIPDTHYMQILVYSPGGELLRKFGAEGRGDGQFVYPVGIAIDDENTYWISEYGGNDRVQRFDSRGRVLLQFGRIGEGPGEFHRPEDLAFDRAGRLYVADSCNHRIQVFERDGRFLRAFGTAGAAPGDLSYPYDLACTPEGTLLVCEYGNHRVQEFSLEGKPLRAWGRAGFGDGELNFPWDLALAPDGRAFWVTDTSNHRVVKFGR